MEETKKENKVLDFFIKTLNGMAYGLFATLIIGTIFGTIGSLFFKGDNGFCQFMANIFCDGGKYTKADGTPGYYSQGLGYILQMMTGAGIGVGIALALKFDPLKTVVLAAVGETASFCSLSAASVKSGTIFDSFPVGKFQIGDPLTVYLVCISVALLIKLVLVKKTPVDILIVPLFGGIIGLALSLLIRYPAIYVTFAMQWIIDQGTTFVPFLMGIVVAVLMGMALTAPISSAAIAAIIFSGAAAGSGLAIASGAAIVGCSAQMVGFAIQSRKDNNIGMVISIGIGTSMLQFKNILKKPIIWLPTIIVSAILGPISTCLLKIVCTGSAAGMGTAGLVGQIGTFASMGNTWQTWVGIFALEIIAPGVLVFFIDLLFRKLGWIKEGDLKI